MKSRYAGRLLAALLLTTLPAMAETAPAFRFAGRYFSPEEAAQIAALPADPPLPADASMKQKIVAQREIAGGIALFARDGIALSADRAALDVAGEILLLPLSARTMLRQRATALGVTPEELFVQESQDVRRQFAAAARAWYHKRFAGRDQISDAQVRDWYFRHQERFLEEKIDAEKCFMLPSREVVPEVLSMLAQGMTPEAVRTAAHCTTLPADVLPWLKSASVTRETPLAGYTLVFDKERTLLMQNDAVKRSYRKLDKELHDAIQTALYDALARARLAEALQTELQNAEFEFVE